MKALKSLQHPLVKRLAQLRKERKARELSCRAVIEGKKLIQENSALVRTLLTTDASIKLSLPQAASIYHATPEMIQKISGVKSPEGIIAEVEIPQLPLPSALQRLLVLEALNDPGNLGTLIRTALAFNWDGVFLLGNCCDPYNDKALRASKGAVFRLPLISGEIDDLKRLLKEKGLVAWIADLNGMDAADVSCKSPMALILGSEAHGVSDQVLALGEAVTIPIKKEMESLNVAVAGGIFLYYLRLS